MERYIYHALLAIAAESTRRRQHGHPQPDTTVRGPGGVQFALVADAGVWQRRRIA